MAEFLLFVLSLIIFILFKTNIQASLQSAAQAHPFCVNVNDFPRKLKFFDEKLVYEIFNIRC
jgi:hypothetical protein